MRRQQHHRSQGRKKCQMGAVLPYASMRVRRKPRKFPGKPRIFMVNWSVVVFCGDSITKLHSVALTMSPTEVVSVMLYSEGLGPFRPWSKPYLSLLKGSGAFRWGQWKSAGKQGRELLSLSESCSHECRTKEKFKEDLKKLLERGKIISVTGSKQGMWILKLKFSEEVCFVGR